MKLKISALILIFVFITLNLYAKKDNISPEKEKEVTLPEVEKLIIFPFYDFTDSGKKFLSSYIPELIKNNLTIEKKITVLDANEIADDLKRLVLNPESLYNKKNALKALNELGGKTGIIGRYMIQGKSIKIDFYSIDNSGKILQGRLFERAIIDDLLVKIEDFSISTNLWIKEFVFQESLSDSLMGKKSIFNTILGKIKNSPIGIVVKNKWIFAPIVLILFYILSLIVTIFNEKVLKRLTSKTNTDIDEQLIDILKKPTKWIVVMFGVKISIIVLKLSPGLSDNLLKITSAVIILLVTFILANFADILIHLWGTKLASKLDSRINNDLVPLFVKFAKIIIISFGVIMVLSGFNVDIAPLIASLGIAGFAIGFAVKDSLSNLIGGIVLIMDKSFAVGDKVTIDGDTGVIQEVGLRNTKLQTYDNEIIVIPNGDLMNSKFKNYVLPDPMIRVIVDFGVAYGTDVDFVEDLVLKKILTIEGIAKDPEPVVIFTEMADSSLNFIAKFWVPSYGDQYGKKLEAVKLVYKTLMAEKISIPFPTHTIYMEKE